MFRGTGAFGMVHNRVFLQTRDTTGRQDLIVLVHTQGLPSKIFHWKSLTVTYSMSQTADQTGRRKSAKVTVFIHDTEFNKESMWFLQDR